MSELKKPFVCEVTKEYCKGRINYLMMSVLEDQDTPIASIPISDNVMMMLDKKIVTKLRKIVLSEIKTQWKERTKENNASKGVRAKRDKN